MFKRVIAIVGLAFAAFAFLGATSASAASAAKEYDSAATHAMTGYSKECISVDDVTGCVMPYGDILWLDDHEADGYGVKLIWWDTDGPRLGECANNHGAVTGWTRCNKNLPEGHDIKWVVSWYEGGSWHNSRSETTRV